MKFTLYRANCRGEERNSLYPIQEEITDAKSMEDVICRIADLETEINQDIDALVDFKQEMMGVIKAVSNLEYQTLLELRFLCFKTWEQIAVAMDYSIQHIYRLRDKAVKEITLPAKDDRKC